MAKFFRDYNLNQPMLIPQDIRTWLPEGHLAFFVSDIIESFDLRQIKASYFIKNSSAGRAPFDPRMMLKLLVYGYCIGVRSSRKIERATFDEVAFRILSGDSHPDHDTIAAFRRRHFKDMGAIFLQVLKLAKKAGLIKMGHVSLDGTKIKANANKSKSRRYEELMKSDLELKKDIERMMADAEDIDTSEDQIYGKGVRGDELPKALQNAKERRKLIKELVAKIEAEAEENRKKIAEEKKQKKTEDDFWEEETGQSIERRYPQDPGTGIKPLFTEARRNPTDFDSRIMKEHQTGGFIQAYNCQAAVDAETQIIVAADVYNQTVDKQLAPPMLRKTSQNTGNIPKFFSADNGYFSERDIITLERLGTDPYIPPTINAGGKRIISVGNKCRKITVTGFMREKLESQTGRRIYKLRKTITEPVFGQIKETQNFRQFYVRGLDKVRGEWQLAALCHNLKKIHRVWSKTR